MINEARLVETFLTLVRIDSPTGNEAAIAVYLKDRLQQLGLTVYQDAAGNLIGWLPGKDTDEEPLLLSAHMDTVSPGCGVRPHIEEGVIWSDGTTILGSDDKSGLAVVLEVLQVLQEHKLAHLPLEIVFTVAEESGLAGAKALDKSQLRSRVGIGLDAGGPVGTMVVSAPAQDKLWAIIHGRAAHAGAEPEKGINAIRVAAEAIVAMPLGRIDEETTANVGTIHGGTATNIVPDTVEIAAEARSRQPDKLAAQTETMLRILRETAARHGATVDLKVERSYEAFALDENTPIVRRARVAARLLGIEPIPEATGGGSDANIFFAAGIPVLNVSTGMADVHTTHEHIAVTDMVRCAQWVLEIIKSG